MSRSYRVHECMWHMTLSHGDTFMCHIWYDYVKGQKAVTQTLSLCQKHYKFDLEVKSQRCIEIMNVCDTLSHGDTPICQIWYAWLTPKKMLLARYWSAQTEGQTVIPIHPLNIVRGGSIEESLQSVINTRDICSGEFNL